MDGEPSYTLTRLAIPDSLTELHALLEQIGTDHPDVQPADLMLFETAVIEIAGNVIEHGQPSGQVTFAFELAVRDSQLECVLTDTSDEPLPALGARAMPDNPESVDGRGLALAEAALDRIECHRLDGANRWTLVRHRR